MRERTLVYLIGQLRRGGTEQHLYDLLRHASARAAVISLSEGGYWAGPLRALGHSVIELKRRHSCDLARLRDVVRSLRATRPDIVHILHDGVHSLYGQLGALLAGQRRVIVDERSSPAIYPGWYRVLRRRLNAGAAAVVCNSRIAEEYFRRRERIHPTRLHVIPNGIDVGRFHRSDPKRIFPWPETWRGTCVIGTVGSLVTWKSPRTFLDVATRIHKQHPSARFVLVGEGPLRRRLELLVEARGLGDVLLLTGERVDVAPLLGAMDVFLLTSRYEGMPHALIEAAASALPCVTTDAGGCRDVVIDGETGFVVPVGDIDGLTDRVTRLLEDPAMRAGMGERGRARVLVEHGCEPMIRRYESLYDSVMQG